MNLFDKLFSGGFTFRNFFSPFTSFQWRDIVDIIVLTLLFFALYRFVRDRRAGKLLKGILVIVGIYAVSILLDLTALRYLLDGVFGYGIIALAVIFQPELRSMMERIGSVPSLHGLKTIGSEQKNMTLPTAGVDAVVDAVRDMSLTKTGALIVIERTTRIGEYIRTGTTLNADLNPELLKAVFFDKAPLHDGAVIVRDGRIYAAGCYLPLSEHTDIFKGLGTRHRAAIGLSEQSDSVIVVVSEETGTISVAHKGELFREFTSVTLRRKLFELLGQQGNSEN